MNPVWNRLGTPDLAALTAALRSRRLSAPYSELQVSRILAAGEVSAVADGLQEWRTAWTDSGES